MQFNNSNLEISLKFRIAECAGNIYIVSKDLTRSFPAWICPVPSHGISKFQINFTCCVCHVTLI